MPRRSLTRVSSLLLVAGVAATLAACSDTTRIPDPTPEPSAAPLFATDEEALAAAVEVYERYLREADEALIDPDRPLSTLEETASDELVENVLAVRANLDEQGLILTGYRTLENSLFQSSVSEDGTTTVTFYVCESVEGTDLLGSDGLSIIEPTRMPLSEWSPTVVFSDDGSQGIVTDRELWQGGGICAPE